MLNDNQQENMGHRITIPTEANGPWPTACAVTDMPFVKEMNSFARLKRALYNIKCY